MPKRGHDVFYSDIWWTENATASTEQNLEVAGAVALLFLAAVEILHVISILYLACVDLFVATNISKKINVSRMRQKDVHIFGLCVLNQCMV